MNQPLLILGMHRSGTSCLAGGLECAGLHLGKVNISAGFNKKGNRENERIRDLHDDVLGSHGFSWDNPPTHALDWTDKQIIELDLRTEEMARHARWGMKDPRAVFCLTGWQKLFRPKFIVTFRHPIAVARSLAFRAEKWGETLRQEKALDLWCSYNLQILAETRNTDTPFIRYDQPTETYLKNLEKIAKILDLDAVKVKEFHSDDLRNQDALSERIPEQCKMIWNELVEHEMNLSAHETD